MMILAHERTRDRPMWQVHEGRRSSPSKFAQQLAARESGPSPLDLLAELPVAALVYVVSVCTVGTVAILQALLSVGEAHSTLFALLLCSSFLASVAKITIPVPGSGSTLSACHVIDVATLILCGPDAAVLIAGWAAWTQSIFRSARPNPLHQVAFSVAQLAITMRLAGTAYALFGGQPAVWSTAPELEPMVAATTVVFFVNTGLVAAAVALSTRAGFYRVWFESFFPSWPSYVIGSGLAATIAIAIERGHYWLLPLLAAPLALVHRNFMAYLGRMTDAFTDPLTGLPNQRYMMEHATRELSRAHRKGSKLTVVVMDLDGFKAINDVEGHAAGDAALKAVADCLRDSIRSHDLCVRYGGDEFLLVLADCGATEALSRVRDLQSAVASIDLNGRSARKMPLGISAGVAVFPEDGDSLERLFTAADAKMYQCKFQQRLARSS